MYATSIILMFIALHQLIKGYQSSAEEAFLDRVFGTSAGMYFCFIPPLSVFALLGWRLAANSEFLRPVLIGIGFLASCSFIFGTMMVAQLAILISSVDQRGNPLPFGSAATWRGVVEPRFVFTHLGWAMLVSIGSLCILGCCYLKYRWPTRPLKPNQQPSTAH
ncbi:hypothetical protein [Herpetosiphon llansteffanensis]|uniref:hypothetical protein n=1 Tax=Herpetosiphon llansteffanensis TaxID=2094568 RepID=UPI000D7CA613|nr:hypothetical protein [Herpetosiphon llansteffanensis]